MRFVLIFLVFVVIGCATTQKAERGAVPDARKSNAFEPYTPEEVRSPPKDRRKKKGRSFRARYNQTLEDKKEEFQERMKANAKRDRKMRREMQKPQYSDPLYFGHKKKPKKRPPGKRKFCKECGIVH